jgi:hypothetical protein
LQSYLDQPKYKLRFVFLVYNGPAMADERVMQWPLGVATYRGFPKATGSKAVLPTPPPPSPPPPPPPKRWLCNFFGTVYAHSSRGTLLAALNQSSIAATKCWINPREAWIPKETKETLAAYQTVLTDSQYTLAPAGQNTECTVPHIFVGIHEF